MGKVQSVTNDNVAEYVKDRKALGSEVKSEVKQEEVKTEPVDSKPAEQDKSKKNSVQERIDELTRKAKEADEFAEDTYEQLTSAQRRIKELESQTQVPTPPKEKKVAPKPTDALYQKTDGTVDQDKFLEDWGKWNREQAVEEFEAKRAKDIQEAEERRLFQEAEARRASSVEAARKEFPDFDDKIEEARASVEMKRRESPNQAVQSLLAESDYGAHILYHLTQHPEDVTKWNKMRLSQVAIAIGRLETQFSKPVESGKTETPAPKTNLPEPTPSLGAGGGAIPVDLSGPTDFRSYKAKRMDELAKKRKR